jgi:hypothetical protein
MLYKKCEQNNKNIDELLKSKTDGARRKCPWGAK